MSSTTVFKLVSSAPSIPTNFVTDNGTAVPAANKLYVVGDSTVSNNINGITTFSTGNDHMAIRLTNRFSGTTTTNDATPTTMGTLILTGVDASYNIEVNVSGLRSAANHGAVGYKIFATILTDGTQALIIGQDKIVNESDGNNGTTDLTAADFNLVVDGVSTNTINLVATGVVGSTIDWYALGTYIVET